MDIKLTAIKFKIFSGFLTAIFCLLLSGCFMESTTPISPVKQSSYPDDIIDTWSMLSNKNVIYLIEAKTKNQLKVTFKGRGNNKNGQVSDVHFSHLDGATFINNKPMYAKHYEFYKISRPCPDLILIHLPNPEQIDKDINSGRLKGRIVQDFFTKRIIEEPQIKLVKYLKKYQKELFIPFRYMIRHSKQGKLSKECKASVKPIPGDPENKHSLQRI